MYNKRMNLNHKNIYKIEIKHDMSYQNTSYDTVYKDYYQYNITMCFFCCNCVSENKNQTNLLCKVLKILQDYLFNNLILNYLFGAAEIAVFCFVVAMPS